MRSALAMKNLTEADYRNYFKRMLLECLEQQFDRMYPEKFVVVRSHFAAKVYLSALRQGEVPHEALDKALQLLLKGIAPQTESSC